MTHRLALLLTAALVLASGCQLNDALSGASDTQNARSDNPADFGDAYHIITEQGPLHGPPRLDGGVLHVGVSYSGGCRTHTFQLQARQRLSGVDLWLVHDANNDLCEAWISETVEVELPVDVRTAPSIDLLLPDGTSFPLR